MSTSGEMWYHTINTVSSKSNNKCLHYPIMIPCSAQDTAALLTLNTAAVVGGAITLLVVMAMAYTCGLLCWLCGESRTTLPQHHAGDMSCSHV